MRKMEEQRWKISEYISARPATGTRKREKDNRRRKAENAKQTQNSQMAPKRKRRRRDTLPPTQINPGKWAGKNQRWTPGTVLVTKDNVVDPERSEVNYFHIYIKARYVLMKSNALL